ncbi:head-tail connector protein [Cereibacter sp. SYSU M97828]|nr:head-tail connector protein [Cereibacter flavus]
MMLSEEGTMLAALPIARLKEHLRLGTGFSDDGMQDGLVESHLRAAIATIEGRIGKVLIARRFRWEISGWRGRSAQALPVAPVSKVVSVEMVGETRLAVTGLRLERDAHRPRLVAGFVLPEVPAGSHVEVVFDAGFGAWDAVPADLQQAVMLLAAEYYENRHEAGLRVSGLPMSVVTLIERWRTVRVLGGGAA